jgi:hypothetical protein
MGVTLPSRRWPLFMSIPIFGLFSLIVVFFFSLAYLNIAFPDPGNGLPTEPGDLSGAQVAFLFPLSAGLSAALAGMLSWGLLMVLRWRWLQTQHWSVTALFGGLIGLIEIISTFCMMWVIYTFFLLLLTQPPIDQAIRLLVILPLGSIGLAVFTLGILAYTTKGLVFLGGIIVGMGFALLARRIFS